MKSQSFLQSVKSTFDQTASLLEISSDLAAKIIAVDRVAQSYISIGI
jgi:hypothetical protein